MQPRVALMMLSLVPGAMGGTETFLRALTTGLDPNAVDVTAYVPRNARGFSGGIHEVVIEEVAGGPSNLARLRAAATGSVLGRRIRRRMLETDVVHYPLTSAFPAMPDSVGRIVTLHDLAHLELPQNFSVAERAYRRIAYEAPAKSADLVLTLSDHARTSIIDRLGIPPDRVRAIPLGVNLERFTPGDQPRDNFLLYPARPYPHKNHARLIEAVRQLRRDEPDLRLVLTGEGLERLGDLPEWVERRGLVSLDELAHLYHTARLMVFPSLFEGFGLPPLEAMASGCPVASSKAASLPEVLGGAAELFDAHSPESIADGIRRALGRTNELVALGMERVRDTGWDPCLRAHERAYREVAERRA